MTAPDTGRLAALMVRWLTHDLASPVATALTASELLGNTADAEINGLVQDAARRLAGRLRLVRTAFAPGEGALGNRALEALIRAGLGDTPLIWVRDGDCSGAEAALVAGAALLLADLRRAAPLTIGQHGAHWSDAWAMPDTIAAALAGAAPDDPRSALAAMVAVAAARQGASLTATADGIGWR